MDLGVEVGEETRFVKTVTDADFLLFCAVSGDHDPIHVSDTDAQAAGFEMRIAHGLLTVSLLSAAESEMSRRIVARGIEAKPLSLGYEKIRFLKPVYPGDTLTAIYSIESIDAENLRAIGDCRVETQDGEAVCVAKHVMKWVRPA
jgi:acyl dehydratase